MDESYLKYFQDNKFLRKKIGFFLISFFIVSFVGVVILWFKVSSYYIFLSAIFILLYFIFWLYFSGRMFFSPNKIKIAFSMPEDESGIKYISTIKNLINENIESLKLSKKIIFIDLPADISFTKSEKAIAYIKTKMIDLLIWGNIIDGNMDSNKIVEFIPHFTYLYRVVPDQVKNLLSKNINRNIRSKCWQIVESNSLQDVKSLSNNFIEVSLYILGSCLLIRGEILNAVIIFERLFAILQQSDKNDEIFKEIFKEVRALLLRLYDFVGEFQRDGFFDGDCIDTYNKALKLDEFSGFANIGIARRHWERSRNLEKAKYYTNIIKDKAFKFHQAYNNAFFAILDNNEIEIMVNYQRIRYEETVNVVDVLDFLNKEKSNDLDNILYDFALGYINVYRADENRGLKDLALFIKEAEKNNQYPLLVSNAKKIVNKRGWSPQEDDQS